MVRSRYPRVFGSASAMATSRAAYVATGGVTPTPSPTPTPTPSPTIAFTNTTASVTEGDSGTKTVSNVINVTRDGVTGPLTVNLTYGGTATRGTDYVAGPVSGTIADGQSSLSFDLTINGDTGVESDETIVINADLAGYSSVTAIKTITVTNDDVPLSGYDVFVLAGQSNMVGRYGPIDATLDATDDRIQMYGYNAQVVALAANPLDHQDETPDTVGMGLSFAKAYIAAGLLAAGRKILLVPVARGDTAFNTGFWRAGGGGDAPAIARTNAAMTQGTPANNVLVGINWHQGEGDASLTQSQYETELDTLIARWRANMTGATPTTPFVCGGLRLTDTGPAMALAATPGRVNRSGYASSSGLVVGGDGLHFDAASQRTFGGRYLTAYQSAKTNNVVAGVPGQVMNGAATTVSGGQSSMSWSAPSSNGGSPITDYIVEYKAQSSSTFLTFADGTSTALSATVTGLTDGTAYDFRVSAVNAVGAGQPSMVFSANTAPVNLVPNSQAFDSGWNLGGLTVTPNVAGTADRLTEDTGVNAHSMSSTANGSTEVGKTYTVTIDVTYENLPFIQIHLPSAVSSSAYANFNIQTGATGVKGSAATSSKITSKGAGVWRIEFTFTASNVGSLVMVVKGIPAINSPRGATYTGTGQSFLANNAQYVVGTDANFYP